MRRIILLLVSMSIPLWAAQESVNLDTKSKKVVNPLVKFGAGNTLDATGATLIGFGSAGSVAFTDLTDVPSSYVGQGLKAVRVNVAENALEFYTPSGGGAVDSVFGRTGVVTAQSGDYTKAQVGLSNVENTALSTWAGSTNITTLGTISTGIWNGSDIGAGFITGTFDNTALRSADLSTSTALIHKWNEASVVSDRTINYKVNSGDRTIDLSGNLTVSQSAVIQGTNTGDQTSIVGITGTKAQFNTAVTDGDFLYVGDIAAAGGAGDVQYNNGSGAFAATSNFDYGTVTSNAITLTLAPPGGNSADGLVLRNLTTATALDGSQVAPVIVMTGQAWSINANASQSADWRFLNYPLGTAGGDAGSILFIQHQENGGGWSNHYIQIDQAGNLGQGGGDATCSFAAFNILDYAILGNGTDIAALYANQYGVLQMAGFPVFGTPRIMWTDGATYYTGTRDTAIGRSEAGGVGIYQGPESSSLGLLRIATQSAGDNSTKGATTAYADALVSDTAFASSWNGVTGIAPSKNAVYDWGHTFDTDDDGKVNVLDQVAGLAFTDAGGVLQTPKVIGTDVQAFDTQLASLAGLSYTGNALKVVRVNAGETDFELATPSGSVDDTAFASSWNGVTTTAPSKNAVYDWGHTFDTDDDGKVNVLDLAAGIPKTDSSGVLSLAVLGTDYLNSTYISDTAFASSWDTVTTIAPSKNAVYDWGHTFDTDDDGKVNVLDLGTAGFVSVDSSGVVATGGSITSPQVAFASGTNALTGDSKLTYATTTGLDAAASNTTVNTVVNALTVRRQETAAGTPAPNFGVGILLTADDSTTANVSIAQIEADWIDATHASADSIMRFGMYNGNSGLANKMYLYSQTNGNGSLSVGTQSDPGSGRINAASGYRVNNSNPATGKFLQSDGGGAYNNSTITLPTSAGSSGKLAQSDGTNIIMSTPTWPTAASTSGKVVKSDGTNLVMSTETYATPSTSGNIMQSDGTNWTSTSNKGGWTELRVAGSDFTTSSTSLVDITGLVSGTLATATLYEVDAQLYCNSSSTAGMAVGVQQSGGGSGQIGVWAGSATNAAATGISISSNALNTAGAPCLLVNGDGMISFKGFIKTGSTGSPTISCKALKTTSGTAKVYIGSVFRFRTAP